VIADMLIFRPNRLANVNEESILSEIKRVINQHFQGKLPRQKEFEKFSLVKSRTICKFFGSWGEAIKKAGFEYKRKIYEFSIIDHHKCKFTKEQMIADLERIKQLNGGKFFSRPFYQANGGKYCTKTLKKYFNCSNWKTLLEQELSIFPLIAKSRIIKPKIQIVSEFSEETLFLELKRVWDNIGRRPYYNEFKDLSRIRVGVFQRKFGSWTSAIEWFYNKSGYNITGDGFRTTPNILLAELEKIVNKHKGIITFERYRDLGGSYSKGAFKKHFGSWKDAVKKIGRQHGGGLYSDEELFAEMQRLWELYGRQPTTIEMSRNSNISVGTFGNRFGSWIKAVHAFCDDRALKEVDNIVYENLPKIDNKASIEKELIQQTLNKSDDSIYKHSEAIIIDTPRSPSLRLRFRVLQRDNFRCLGCGRSPATHLGVELHVDHITPYSQGGSTIIENLRTLCKDCNLGKSDIMP
jgi:hypothetical protein